MVLIYVGYCLISDCVGYMLLGVVIVLMFLVSFVWSGLLGSGMCLFWLILRLVLVWLNLHRVWGFDDFCCLRFLF